MKTRSSLRVCVLLLLVMRSGRMQAQVPQLLTYQGRVVVGTTAFTGTGQFKFTLASAFDALAAVGTDREMINRGGINRGALNDTFSFDPGHVMSLNQQP